MKVCIINGPNLNMLGRREPVVYGNLSLNQINEKIKKKADLFSVEVDFFQSNIEGEIVTRIQKLTDEGFDALILNAAAYTHTSIAIRDALLAVSLPFVEVHLSNIFKRELFRSKSYLSDIALGIVSGFGYKSYEMALEGIVDYLKTNSSK
jgi:3-dehydroquinate dehydratase-2